jgi:hypothetical protein
MFFLFMRLYEITWRVNIGKRRHLKTEPQSAQHFEVIKIKMNVVEVR